MSPKDTPKVSDTRWSLANVQALQGAHAAHVGQIKTAHEEELRRQAAQWRNILHVVGAHETPDGWTNCRAVALTSELDALRTVQSKLVISPALRWLTTILVMSAFAYLTLALQFSLQHQRYSLDAIAGAVNKLRDPINTSGPPTSTWPTESGTGATLPTVPIITKQPPHVLELHLLANCWIRVTEETPDAATLLEGNVPKGLHKEFTFDETTAVEVRAGCPGAIEYTVDGVVTLPVNQSGKPKDSEVVDLKL
jgi:hypothetical protein